MRVGLPRTVRSNTIFPPEGENAGCSASPASLAVMLIGFGRPPPGGYRSITKRSPGPPLLGLPTYTMCGPLSGEKAGSRSLRRSFGVRSERPLPSAFMNQIELFDDEAECPENAISPRLPSQAACADWGATSDRATLAATARTASRPERRATRRGLWRVIPPATACQNSVRSTLMQQTCPPRRDPVAKWSPSRRNGPVDRRPLGRPLGGAGPAERGHHRSLTV